MKPALRTRICELFGVEYPIVQTGMGWVSGARLTAATSEAGGLGILASATMTFEQLKTAVHEVKDRTKKPFGVNLRTDQADIRERVDFMIAEKVRVASFAQAPSKELVARLKEAKIVTMPTVGARRHAEKVASWGVDAVIAQGHEGGGHTGAIPTTLLLPDVAKAVSIPVLGAGGFHDGRGLVAALAYGASGIAMGTRFLLTKESTVPEAIKKLYVDTPLTGTVVTKSIDGVPQRVIRTKLIEALEGSTQVAALARAAVHAFQFRALSDASMIDLFREGLAMKKSQELTWGQFAMAPNAPMYTKAGLVDGRPDVGVLPTGQVVGVITELPSVKELLERIIKEADETLERLGALDVPSPHVENRNRNPGRSHPRAEGGRQGAPRVASRRDRQGRREHGEGRLSHRRGASRRAAVRSPLRRVRARRSHRRDVHAGPRAELGLVVRCGVRSIPVGDGGSGQDHGSALHAARRYGGDARLRGDEGRVTALAAYAPRFPIHSIGASSAM